MSLSYSRLFSNLSNDVLNRIAFTYLNFEFFFCSFYSYLFYTSTYLFILFYTSSMKRIVIQIIVVYE